MQSPFMKLHIKTSGVTGPKLARCLAIVFFSFFFHDGVNATIPVAIRPPVVE